MAEMFAGSSFPRLAVFAGATLVGLSMVFAGVARTTDIGATRLVSAPIVELVSLRFLDDPAGGINVETVKGAHIAHFAAGEGGFLRGVMRGFARDRRARELGSKPAFEVARHADGRITLADPQSGRIIELNSFGPSNSGLFENFLTTARNKT
jgi:putative photosynthetic complex assembly protein